MTEYRIGYDPYTEDGSNTNSVLVIFKLKDNRYELVKVYKWYHRMKWIQRLRYRLMIWKLYWFYYRHNTTIIQEINTPSPPKRMRR